MWEDDSIINEIYGYVGECESAASAGYDFGFPGGLRAELPGGVSTVREYADGSRIEAIPMNLSLHVKALTPSDSMRAIGVLERLCCELKHITYVGRVKGVCVTDGPFKDAERSGVADYGIKLIFYVHSQGDSNMLPRWYVNVGDADSPDWERIGEGFTLFEQDRGAEVYSRRYIHSSEYVNSVVGYSDKIRYAFEANAPGGAAKLFRNIYVIGSVGKKVEVLEVFPDKIDCTDAEKDDRFAVKRTYSIAVGSTECEAGVFMYTGELLGCSGQNVGVFNTEAAVFRAVDAADGGLAEDEYGH